MPVSVSFHAVGSHRFVRAVHTEEARVAETNGASAHDEVEFCLVLDRSGSMGAYSQALATEGLAALCMQLNLSPDKLITLVTFDSVIETQRVRVRDLMSIVARCRGSTSLRGISTTLAHSAFADSTRTKRNSLRLLVVSDGQIDDQEGVVREMQQLCVLNAKLGPAAPRISVCLVRLFTSSYGAPDTRALAAFGLLAAEGRVPLHDVETTLETVACDVARIACAHFENDGLAGARTTLRCSLPALRRSPAEPRGVTECTIAPRGETWLLLDIAPDASDAPDHCATITLVSETDGATRETAIAIGAAEPVTDERQLLPLLRTIDAQLRMRIAATNSVSDDASKATFAWLRSAQSALSAITAGTSTAGGDGNNGAPVSMRARDRAHQLVRAIEKRRGSLMQSMLELANVDTLSTLNSAQARADFVRAISSTRAGRSVAKRAAKGGDVDFDELAREAVRKIGAATQQFDPDDDDDDDDDLDSDDGPASFYMQDVTRGYLVGAAGELYRDAATLDELAHDDVLASVGLVGLAYDGTVGDVADPWSYTVRRVFHGTYLSQADLWTAFRQGGGSGAGSTATLGVPGMRNAETGAPLTLSGVVLADVALMPAPMTESAVAFAMREAQRLVAMHASFSMRHAIALVPYDTLAHVAAALWCCLLEGAQAQARDSAAGVSEAWARSVLQLLGALRTVARATRALEGDGALAKLAAAMQSTATETDASDGANDSERESESERKIFLVVKRNSLLREMCGAEGVSSALMPFCVMLCAPSLVLEAESGNASAVLDAVLNFALYVADRARHRYAESAEARTAKRRAELCALLGVDIEKMATPLQPLGTPEPTNIEHCDALNSDDVAARALAGPDTTLATAVFAIPHLLAAISKAAGANPGAGVARLDPAAFRDEARAAFSKARVETKERAFALAEHRTIILSNTDGEKGRLAAFSSMHSASSDDYDRANLMRDQVRALYREDYDKRVAAKRVEEERLRVERTLAALSGASTIAEFVALLASEMPARSSNGASQIVTTLLARRSTSDSATDADANADALLADKLFILLTGRNCEGEPVWCNGAALHGKIGVLRATLRSLGERGREMDESVSAFARLYRRHDYRASKSNRHGHSNEMPSYAALGYASVDAMREAVSTDEWAAYCAQHKRCCGFGGKEWTVEKRAGAVRR